MTDKESAAFFASYTVLNESDYPLFSNDITFQCYLRYEQSDEWRNFLTKLKHTILEIEKDTPGVTPNCKVSFVSFNRIGEYA